jgi:hypothetical protein
MIKKLAPSEYLQDVNDHMITNSAEKVWAYEFLRIKQNQNNVP